MEYLEQPLVAREDSFAVPTWFLAGGNSSKWTEVAFYETVFIVEPPPAFAEVSECWMKENKDASLSLNGD